MWHAAASRLLRSQYPPPSMAACTLRHTRLFSPPPPQPRPGPEAEVTAAEARRLERLVGVETLKRRLREDGRGEVVGYGELLDACVEAGAARTRGEAETLARAMDDAGVVLLFRDKAYLHPEKGLGSKRRDDLAILHHSRIFCGRCMGLFELDAH